MNEFSNDSILLEGHKSYKSIRITEIDENRAIKTHKIKNEKKS